MVARCPRKFVCDEFGSSSLDTCREISPAKNKASGNLKVPVATHIGKTNGHEQEKRENLLSEIRSCSSGRWKD